MPARRKKVTVQHDGAPGHSSTEKLLVEAGRKRKRGEPLIARGTDSTGESDGDDSDGQGTYQGGEGVRSTPPLSPAQRKFFRCLGVKRPVS